MSLKGRGLSLGRKLPLLICGLLVLLVAASFAAAYVEVRREALAGARERVTGVSAQIAEIVRGLAARMRREMEPVAQRLAVMPYLRSQDAATEAATQRLLDTVTSRQTAVAGAEVWGPDATPLLTSGRAGATDREESRQLISRISESDTAIIGSLRQLDGSAHFPIVAPMRDSTRAILGYFVLHRRFSSSPQEMQQVRDLIGEDVGILVGSPETRVWTDLSEVKTAPPIPVGWTDPLNEYRDGERGWQLAGAAAVPGTPWTAVVEFPRGPVLAGAQALLGRFAIVAAVLLLVGWIGALWLSRDISRPLEHLATEANAIARGDFSRRVDAGRSDELGALAGAFNTMARSVGDSVEQLANDLRERKRAEAALLAADELIRAMVAASPLPIIALDIDGRIKMWSQAAEGLFGWHQSEVLGQPLPGLTERQRQEHEDLRQRAMNGEVFTGNEVTRTRRDGTPLLLRLSCAATYDAEGVATGVTTVLEDITQSRKLEDQFRQSQKMEAVGRLAGGVAHDFNNLLTVVLGASDLLLSEIPTDDPQRSTIIEIREAGERAAGLTTQLLAFSRKQLVEPTVFVVNQLVRDVERMLRRLIGEDIEMSVRIQNDVGAIHADRGHIEQVLVNLAVNARDAMPNGGLLVIETANVELDEEYTRVHASVVPGSYVALSVSDSGTGMSAGTKAHLFEPFFTTKASGKGTGLGLATCYGIVKQSGGHIGVYSEEGVGTTMKVYLPRVAGDAAAAQKPETPAQRGSETILLVEDEAAVRNITRRMLTSHGYRVLEAADGPEAIAILRDAGEPIHLLLTDVVLPGMGGRAVAEEARSLNPHINVLFISGYTDDVILQHKLLEHNVSLLQKPFTSRSLAEKVRSVLD
jgi:PAS domain S-box-containing protein